MDEVIESHPLHPLLYIFSLPLRQSSFLNYNGSVVGSCIAIHRIKYAQATWSCFGFVHHTYL